MGYENVIEYTTPLEKLIPNLNLYQGLVIRSRFPIDKEFIDLATNSQIYSTCRSRFRKYRYILC